MWYCTTILMVNGLEIKTILIKDIRKITTKDFDMDIKVNIDFSGYSPQQIIKMIEDGIVTRREVVHSGIAHSFFTPILASYLDEKHFNELEDTVAA